MAAATVRYSVNGVTPIVNGDEAIQQQVMLKPSVTYPAGQVLGEVTATPGLFGKYVDADATGLGVAKCILQYPCKTDAAGLIWYGDTVSISDSGLSAGKATPAWRSGVFKCADLVGLDAAALVDLGARLLTGDINTGLVLLTGE
jgi:hypothetical protein